MHCFYISQTFPPEWRGDLHWTGEHPWSIYPKNEISLKSLLLKAHVSFTLFFPIRCLLVSIKNGGGGPKSLSKDVKEGHCVHLWLCTQMQLWALTTSKEPSTASFWAPSASKTCQRHPQPHQKGGDTDISHFPRLLEVGLTSAGLSERGL